MKTLKGMLLAMLIVFVLAAGVLGAYSGRNSKDICNDTNQEKLSLEEYLENTNEKWFLTGKREYTIQAMMVSGELSFHNDLELADYTVTDDGETVVLKGTRNEMWTSPLSKVTEKYVKPDGSKLSAKDFADKDVFIDIVTIPVHNSSFAIHVPNHVSVTVETAWGNVLHTNLPNAPHGEGDYLICNVGEDGEPSLSDVWIVNGLVFLDCYDTSHMKE